MKTNATKTTKRSTKATEQVKTQNFEISLTTKENKLLNSLVSLLTSEPGFSDIDCNDISKATKMKVEEVKGLVGSLVKKELLFTSKTDNSASDEQFDLVYLAPLAWSIHPDWKNESEFELTIKVSDEKKSNVRSLKNSDKTMEKTVNKTKKTDTKAKEEKIMPDKNKPYGVFGMHGKNVDLKGFKKGDKVKFILKGKEVVGEYVHFHINNWSKKGYAVIKYDGKIFERVEGKFSNIKKTSVK